MAETSTPLPPPPPPPPSLDPTPQPDNPNPQPESTPTTITTTPPPQPQQSTPLNPNPNIPQILPYPNPMPNPNPNQFAQPLPPPPSLGSSPSFRPAGAPIPPNFTPIPPNPNLSQVSYPTPPPGVGAPQQIYPGQVPGSNPGLRPPPFVALPNGGFLGPTLPQGSVPPPGVIRYPFPPIARPPFITRPPVAVGTVPPQPRPPLVGVRPTPQIIRPPILPIIIPAEKPQTTVYVGKIAPSVENEFIRSLLELCGPIKSWKRAQDPSDGTPIRFGFCEFESAEGVLRALRLLTKCNVDGEELVLNVNQATRDYLERYVKKKKDNLNKPSEIGADEAKKEGQNLSEVQIGEGDKPNEASKSAVDEPKKDENETENKESDVSVFGLVTDEDRDADREAQEKITNMIEERVKNKPVLPPPPPAPAQKVVDSANDSNMEVLAKSGDKESDVDVKKEEKNDDETIETKPASRAGTDSPDRGRRHDSRGRDRERERDKRDKERELDRLERERERERARRERERELEIQRAERFYKERVKEWEAREKDKEYKRKQERDKEKDKERERRKLIAEQEDESDDDTSRKRRRKSDIEDKRRRRRREKEEDLADRLKEEEEIAEAKKRAEEEEQQRQQEIAASVEMANGVESSVPEEESIEIKHDVETVQDSESVPENHTGDGFLENGNNDDAAMASGPTIVKQGGNAPAKKLGFGLVGSGKRAAVPSVFHEEEDDDAHKEKKLRPLVPIDYSAEENDTSHTTDTTMLVNSSASAESGKPVPKEVKSDAERERGRRSHDRSSHRERDRDGNDGRARDGNAILDAKQLIDMIPKTKDDLFSYEINWPVYDENRLHERMRPWISKKITEFLGEEETTLVEFIVDKFREHVKAETMLDILQQVLDEEAEMFVLKMWRMLIFEIKRVETGLAPRPGA